MSQDVFYTCDPRKNSECKKQGAGMWTAMKSAPVTRQVWKSAPQATSRAGRFLRNCWKGKRCQDDGKKFDC